MALISSGPSLTYLVRIMDVLTAHGELTVTNLAMLSRMNHKRCNDMIEWLKCSGYVRTSLFKNRRYIALTETGRAYAGRLLEVNGMTHFPNKPMNTMYVQNVSQPY